MSDEPHEGPAGESPPPPPVVSPDGKFWWDGAQWQPFTTHGDASTSRQPSQTGHPQATEPASAARVILPATDTASHEAPTNAGSSFRWSWLLRAAVPLAVLG